MKRIAATVICFLTILIIFPATSSADMFESEYGLHRAVVLIRNGDDEAFSRAMEFAEKSGAKGLLGLPPTMIYGRFPETLSTSIFIDLDVRIVTDPRDIDPLEVDLVTLKAARGLLEQEKILSMSKPIPMEPFDDIVFDRPLDIIRESAAKYTGPRQGAPAEMTDRPMDQNTEFLIGNVLVNLILPESSGGNQSEDWTDDEIGLVIRDVLLGLSQYENATHWVPLTFTLHCPQIQRGVPVQLEPIMGDWNTDGIWITEAIRYLGEANDVDIDPEAWAQVATHTYNNAMRNRYLDSTGRHIYDWVFTAYVVDASVNECWQGPAGQYAAYTIFLGGPYMVVPYPACGFGDGLNFAHVFIHEMSHVFWALDEYASAAAACNARSGYLNYINANSYYEGCGVGEDCIMNNYLLTEPLPICRWTMGQVGLADDNNPPNSIPDIFEVQPVLECSTEGSDTTYFGDIIIWLDCDQTPIPNKNQMIEEYRRIDYAPEIYKLSMSINDGFLEPVPGNWNGVSSFNWPFILREGLDPGENWVHFTVQNIVGLTDTSHVMVYFVGIRYYASSAMTVENDIEIRWQTATEIFGADFEIHRQDVTSRGSWELLVSVDGDSPYEDIGERKRYRYMDETIVAGHTYRYKVIGEIDVVLNSEPQTFVYESGEMSETATVPLAGNLVSPTIPNPTDDRGATFSVDVPKSYYDPSGTTSRDIMRAPMAETKTEVLVNVYDVAGRKVREVYNLSVFGGQVITMTWDGLDETGSPVATGVYFMKVMAGEEEQVRKVVIIR